jgi:hypothetical protein
MPPQQPVLEGNEHPDEVTCGERINYWLQKLGCALVPVLEIRGGQVKTRVDIVKLPPEVIKQMKKAQNGGAQPPAAPAPSA